MKKVLAFLLSFILVMSMAACGTKEGTSSDKSENAKTPNVSVTIDGLTYNEKEYNYYLNVTVTNETDKDIKGYASSVYLNGYFLDGTVSLKCDAKSTATGNILISREWLVYYYNLCNLTVVDNAALTLQLTDSKTAESIGSITANSKIEKFKFEESNLAASDFKTDINKEVYNDNKCTITLLTFNQDQFKNPTAYFLVENASIADKVYLNYKRKDSYSYSEIIEDMDNKGEEISGEINGKKIPFGKFVDLPGEEGLSKGNKTIAAVSLVLEGTGISLKDIVSMKKDFVIENNDTLNNTKYAEFTVDWNK